MQKLKNIYYVAWLSIYFISAFILYLIIKSVNLALFIAGISNYLLFHFIINPILKPYVTGNIFSGILTENDGLPKGFEVRYSRAAHAPIVKNDILGTTLDFGEGSVLVIKPNRLVTTMSKPKTALIEVVDLLKTNS